MNKQTAKNYIIGSVVATMFIGLGFGITIATCLIPVIILNSFVFSFGGLVLGIVSLIVMFNLLRKVEKAGYVIKMVKKEGGEKIK